MRQRRLMNQINVVPYIDVMLVLLVIFMVTAPMIQQGTINVPSAGAGTPPPQRSQRRPCASPSGVSPSARRPSSMRRIASWPWWARPARRSIWASSLGRASRR